MTTKESESKSEREGKRTSEWYYEVREERERDSCLLANA